MKEEESLKLLQDIHKMVSEIKDNMGNVPRMQEDNGFVDRYHTLLDSMENGKPKDWEIVKKASELTDDMKFNNIASFMKNNGVEGFSKHKFHSYIDRELIPGIKKKGSNVTLYSKDHVMWFLWIEKAKWIVEYDDMKKFVDVFEDYATFKGMRKILDDYSSQDTTMHNLLDKLIEMTVTEVTEAVKQEVGESKLNEDSLDYLEYSMDVDTMITLLALSINIKDKMSQIMDKYKERALLNNEFDMLIDNYIKDSLKDDKEIYDKYDLYNKLKESLGYETEELINLRDDLEPYIYEKTKLSEIEDRVFSLPTIKEQLSKLKELLDIIE